MRATLVGPTVLRSKAAQARAGHDLSLTVGVTLVPMSSAAVHSMSIAQ